MFMNGSGYATLEHVFEEVPNEVQRSGDLNTRIPRWISKWSNVVDDMVRQRYMTPFAPPCQRMLMAGTLNMIVTYFVVHNIYVYQGLYRGNEDAEQQSYFHQAMKLVDKLVTGAIQLPTDCVDPADLLNPNLVVATIGTNQSALYSPESTNPLSMRNQANEFGNPVSGSRIYSYSRGDLQRFMNDPEGGS